MELKNGASVSASTVEGIDILCYGAIVDHGAVIDGEAEVLGGIHHK
jgi:hypothetical protein